MVSEFMSYSFMNLQHQQHPALWTVSVKVTQSKTIPEQLSEISLSVLVSLNLL